MKKSIVIVMTLFSFLSGYSQTGKGKKFLGGQISFSNATQSELDAASDVTYDTKNLQFQFMPEFGYFIKDNLAIGLNLNFGVSSRSTTSDVVYTSNKLNSINYGGGGYVRYYSKIADKFYFILSGILTYTFTQDKDEITDVKTNINNISLAIGPGLAYFITPKLGLQGSLGSIFYNAMRSKGNNTDSYGISLNLSTFNFGLSYYF